MDPKKQKDLSNLCIKIGQIYTDIYILKTNIVLSMNIELPYIISLTEEQTNLFKEYCGDFKVLHIPDVRLFKKVLIQKEEEEGEIAPSSTYEILELPSKITKVVNMQSRYLEDIRKVEKWIPFHFYNDEKDNLHMMDELFIKNNSVNLLPEDHPDGPEIMLTKSLLPAITEKNYTDLSYATLKKMDNLYCIIFYIRLPLFSLCMIHHYIPFGGNDASV